MLAGNFHEIAIVLGTRRRCHSGQRRGFQAGKGLDDSKFAGLDIHPLDGAAASAIYLHPDFAVHVRGSRSHHGNLGSVGVHLFGKRKHLKFLGLLVEFCGYSPLELQSNPEMFPLPCLPLYLKSPVWLVRLERGHGVFFHLAGAGGQLPDKHLCEIHIPGHAFRIHNHIMRLRHFPRKIVLRNDYVCRPAFWGAAVF